MTREGEGGGINQAGQSRAQSGAIGGAGLDVADPEPLPPEHPLWSAPNLLLSPHIAVGGGYRRLAMFIAENLQRFAWGAQPHALVQLPT